MLTLQNITKLKTQPLVNPKFCKWFYEDDSIKKTVGKKLQRQYVNPTPGGKAESGRRSSCCNIIQRALRAAGETLRIDSEDKVNIVCHYQMGLIDSGKSSYKQGRNIVRALRMILDLQGWCPDVLVRWNMVDGVRLLQPGLKLQKGVELQR